MRSKTIFLFLFLLVIPFSFAVFPDPTTILFNTTFNYTDAHTNHGWTYSSTGCGTGSPVSTVDQSQGWGTAGITCAVSGSHNGRYSFPHINYSGYAGDDQLIVVANLSFRATSPTSNPFSLTLRNTAGSSVAFLNIFVDTANPRYLQVASIVGVTYCYDWAIPQDYGVYELTWILDITDFEQHVLLDGVATNCTNVDLTSTAPFYNFSEIRLFQSIEGNSNMTAVTDDLSIFVGNVGGLEFCEYPLLFCDDFDDTGTLAGRDWIVYDYDSSINTLFASNGENVTFNDSEPKSIGHEIERFPVDYPTSESETTTESIFSPVFTNDFRIRLYNNTARLVDFKAFDYQGDLCWIMRINGTGVGTDIRVWNITTSDFQDFVLDINNDIDYDVKAITSFTHINKSYRFNTSRGYSNVQFWWGSNSVDMPVPSACDNIDNPNIVRELATSNFTMDDYYMYVGTDPVVDTVPFYVVPLYEEVDEDEPVDEDTETAEFSDVVDDLWSDFGMDTTRSRLMFGLGLLTLFGIMIAFTMIKAGAGAGAVIGGVMILSILFMVFLVFLQLLPIWILVLFFMLGAGGSALFIKLQIDS